MQALALQKRVVDYGPDTAAFRLTLARLQLTNGKREEAAANIERLLKLGPSSAVHEEATQLAEQLRKKT